MALKAYYDGSGKSDNLACKFVTLAGFSASQETWDVLEPEWKRLVKSHGANYFHASEAWALHEEFDQIKGWDSTKVSRLANELLQLIANFRRYDDPSRTDLLGFSCTVNLADHRELAQHHSGAIKDPASMCVDWCAGLQFSRNPSPSPGYLLLYFDRTEEFLHKVKRVWDQRASRRPDWAQYIASIAPIDDMRLSPALQLADFLAWSTNRKYNSGEEQYHSTFMLTSAVFHKYYDKESLCAMMEP
jgi:Protein of unknown function (DUF3800)